MRTLLTATLLMLLSTLACFNKLAAQESPPQLDSTDSLQFHIVEQVPSFPGGQQGLLNHISTNTKYPAKAKKKNIQGTVIVQFMVNEEGFVDMDSTSLLQSVHPLLDEEALRVVSIMPKWTPGMQRGKPVRVYYKLPFRFYLKETEK